MRACLRVERNDESSPHGDKTGGFDLAPCRYRMDGLPPVSYSQRLELELKLVPESEREDAVQVAWVAHLDGEDAGLAVKKWWVGTLRRRRREQTNLL